MATTSPDAILKVWQKTLDGISAAFKGLNQVALTAFGGITSAMSKVTEGLGGIGKAVQAVAGNLSGAFSRVQSALAQTVNLANPAIWQRFVQTQQDLYAVVGQLLVPALQVVTGLVRSFADWILNLDPGIRKLITIVAAAGAAIAGMGVAFQALSPLLTVAISGITALGGALSAALGPIGPIVVIVGALAAALGLLAASTEESGAILKSFGDLFTSLKDTLLTLMGTLLRAVQPVLAAIGDSFAKAVQTVAPALGQLAQSLAGPLAAVAGLAAQGFGVLTKLAQPLATVFAQIVEALQPLFDLLTALANEALAALQPILEQMSAIFANLAQSIGQQLSSALKAMTPLVGIMGDALLKLIGPLGELANALISVWAQMQQLYTGVLIQLIESMVSLGAVVLPILVAAIKPVIQFTIEMVKWMSAFLEKINEVVKAIQDKLGPALEVLLRSAEKLGLYTPHTVADRTATRVATTDDRERRSSVGAAARPAQFTSIEEYARQAQLAAYSAGVVSPETKAIKEGNEQRKGMLDLLRRLVQKGEDPYGSRAALRGY